MSGGLFYAMFWGFAVGYLVGKWVGIGIGYDVRRRQVPDREKS